MYRIAICDDEENFRTVIAEKLKEVFGQKDVPVQVLPFSDARELIVTLKEGAGIDAIFLDIVMPGTDGIKGGRWLRKNASEIPIIYVSSRDDMVFKTFQARPFQYIRKNRLNAELPGVVGELISELENNRENDDTIEIAADNREVFSFHTNEIMYVEVMGKDCIVWLSRADDGCTTKCRLKVYEDILSDKGFIRIHKSYLVNCRYIFQIRSSDIQLDNGVLLPVSRHRLNDVKKDFLKYSGIGDKRKEP